MTRADREVNPRAALTVLHIGSLSNPTGGISRVAHQWSVWDMPGIDQRMLATTRQRGRLSDMVCVARACREVLRLRGSGLVIHAHLSQEGAWREGLVMRFGRVVGVRSVAHLHGSRFASYASRHRRRVVSALTPAAVILCLTRETLDLVTVLAPSVPVHLIYNCEVAAPRLEEATMSVVFVGAVGLRKGADIVLSSWKVLPADVLAMGWTLDVYGPVDDDFDASALAAELQGVTLHGPVSHGVVLRALSTADVAVLPSRAEAFPMFLLEAMAHGAIPVATDVGDIARLVGDAGRLCAPADPGAFAEALVSLLREDATTRDALRHRAHRRVDEHWNPARLQELVLPVWRSLVR